jgi:mono/diheme cytochrome c family protein
MTLTLVWKESTMSITEPKRMKVVKLCLIASVLGGASAALAWDMTTLTAAGRAEQPVPTGHQVGKDNGDDNAHQEGGLHFAGEDCAICHTPGGKAGKHVFTMSGTLYKDRFGSMPLAGAEVILQGPNGKTLSMTTNSAGNFWTNAELGSNPTSIASHGGMTELLYAVAADGKITPADPNDPRTWQYKAWIKNGDAVHAMITIAPVGGSTTSTPRMSCGMHHSPLGSTGAAWVSQAPSLTEYPKEKVSFKRHVQPMLQAKCAPCHIPGERITRLVNDTDVRAEEPTTLDYSGAKDFTSYAGSMYMTGTGANAREEYKDGVIDSVDMDNPEESKLLLAPKIHKPGSKVEHPSGGFWTTDDADYKLIHQWIIEGAQDN